MAGDAQHWAIAVETWNDLSGISLHTCGKNIEKLSGNLNSDPPEKSGLTDVQNAHNQKPVSYNRKRVNEFFWPSVFFTPPLLGGVLPPT